MITPNRRSEDWLSRSLSGQVSNVGSDRITVMHPHGWKIDLLVGGRERIKLSVGSAAEPAASLTAKPMARPTLLGIRVGQHVIFADRDTDDSRSWGLYPVVTKRAKRQGRRAIPKVAHSITKSTAKPPARAAAPEPVAAPAPTTITAATRAGIITGPDPTQRPVAISPVHRPPEPLVTEVPTRRRRSATRPAGAPAHPYRA